MTNFFKEVYSYSLYIAGGLVAGTIIGFALFHFVEFLKGLGI